ncbi:anthranilate phosphoribosyltransferase, partial [bacterium]|nr:anthranilate phosphoribosyltransferase [bacterium]
MATMDDIIRRLYDGADLSADMAEALMAHVMDGQLDEPRLAAMLAVMRLKGV